MTIYVRKSRDCNRVIVFKGPDSSSALTKWEANCHLIVGEFDEFDELDVPARTSVEWNSDGTQLAAICYNGLIAVWNYPNNDKLFKYSTKISQHSKNGLEPIRS
ncbi:hypothetical protein DAPPUDRAFT_237880 [Daphnia pulex]|uniref:Uncharacterized protein n=1 Tax=Daphnia pulex TaxID=6669 RepID=E9G4N1_DAPPU|nr:hypothetical protein DAPPUDRAFT_237880 [Daphnia pulex]|eukprot:EFX85327.1 hypothetical protein DAPPUDRAFT_237880 [Daphnia pulex]